MSELERWEARFAAPGYHFGTEPNAFLKSKVGLLKPGQKALSMTADDVAEVVLFVLTRPRNHRILETAFRPVTETSWG